MRSRGPAPQEAATRSWASSPSSYEGGENQSSACPCCRAKHKGPKAPEETSAHEPWRAPTPSAAGKPSPGKLSSPGRGRTAQGTPVRRAEVRAQLGRCQRGPRQRTSAGAKSKLSMRHVFGFEYCSLSVWILFSLHPARRQVQRGPSADARWIGRASPAW
eukprot:scaffold1355_cov268-Pinguiococcus_pyrenoidosus.AAC.9